MTESMKEGLKLYKAGRYEQALYYFDEDDPVTLPETAYHMALCHLGLGHYAEALELLGAVLDKDDHLLRILQCQILKAYVLIQLDDWPGAEEWLVRLLAEGTESSQVRALLGYALFRQGRKVESLNQLNTALKKSPGNANLMNSLGYLLAEEGLHLGKALNLVYKAHLADPENAAYLDSLGWVYYRMNKPDSALGYLEKAFAKNQDPLIKKHLDAVRTHLGKTPGVR